MSVILEARNLKFSYKIGEPVLRSVSFVIEQGDFVAVTGPSGSGKSTLFYLLGALAENFDGEILFRGTNYQRMNAKEKSIFRNREIGFVFQQFHLLARATVLDNVLLPTYYPYDTSLPTHQDRERAMEILSHLGIEELAHRKPQELSGGQQQRVAIARALIRNPNIVLADEPTGNLDSKSAAAVMEIFKKLHAEGKTVILVTHSSEVSAQCSRVLKFKDGQLESDTRLTPLKKTAVDAQVSHLEPRLEKFPFSSYLRAMVPAWQNVTRTKAKSALTMLGVVLGIAAVLTTMSLGSYTKQRILDSYQSLGVNTLNFAGYQNWRGTGKDFSISIFKEFSWKSDVLAMMRVFPDIEYASPISRGGQEETFNYGGQAFKENISVYGVNEQYFLISNQTLSIGRHLSYLDIENANPVCVIGADVHTKLFAGVTPISKTITVASSYDSNYPCRVVGVLAPQPAPPDGGFRPDSAIYIPYTYSVKNISNPWQRAIMELRLKVADGGDPDEVGKQIMGYFKSRYGTSGEFNFYSNAKVIAQMKLFLTVFSLLLTAVASIALVVGGVGINNMMLVNLSERLKELGLRKALGATPTQIRALVLTESIVICGIGGVIGIVFGVIGYQSLIFAATKLLKDIQYEWIFQPGAILASTSAIILTGILSGLVPALRAERLQVIDALRQE